MPASSLRARPKLRRAVVGVIAIAAWIGGAFAQSTDRQPSPPGIPWGPVVIAPSVTAGYSYDSNVFYRSTDLGVQSDNIQTVAPKVVLTVPFLNSLFQFADTYSWMNYKETTLAGGDSSNDAAADLDLRFSTFDHLELSAHHINGIAETVEFDPGGAYTFKGDSYRLHTESALLGREIDGKRGYRFRLTRNALTFNTFERADFDNYSGFDAEAAYVQPLSLNTRISFGYVGSRYDHYNRSDPDTLVRVESGDIAYSEIEGRLGLRQPYKVRLGWEWLGFTGTEAAAASYSGLVLQADVNFIVGGGTVLGVTAARQPYRSFFVGNNFYVFNTLSLSIKRAFPHGTTFGGSVGAARTVYPDPVPPGNLAAGTLRVDRSIAVEAYANLAVWERCEFRLSVRKNTKASNYPGVDYDDLVVFGGLVFGWF